MVSLSTFARTSPFARVISASYELRAAAEPVGMIHGAGDGVDDILATVRRVIDLAPVLQLQRLRLADQDGVRVVGELVRVQQFLECVVAVQVTVERELLGAIAFLAEYLHPVL